MAPYQRALRWSLGSSERKRAPASTTLRRGFGARLGARFLDHRVGSLVSARCSSSFRSSWSPSCPSSSIPTEDIGRARPSRSNCRPVLPWRRPTPPSQHLTGCANLPKSRLELLLGRFSDHELRRRRRRRRRRVRRANLTVNSARLIATSVRRPSRRRWGRSFDRRPVPASSSVAAGGGGGQPADYRSSRRRRGHARERRSARRARNARRARPVQRGVVRSPRAAGNPDHAQAGRGGPGRRLDPSDQPGGAGRHPGRRRSTPAEIQSRRPPDPDPGHAGRGRPQLAGGDPEPEGPDRVRRSCSHVGRGRHRLWRGPKPAQPLRSPPRRQHLGRDDRHDPGRGLNRGERASRD